MACDADFQSCALLSHWNQDAAAPEIRTLLALILSGGRESGSAEAATARLLRHFDSPALMVQSSPGEFQRIGRMSARQALRLSAAIAFGREVCSQPLRPGQRFASSRDIYERYRARYFSAMRECFLALHLNSKNQLLREALVSIGSLSTSVVHPREAFAPAVRDSAAAVVFVHNHPSGDPSPSREDRECTARLFNAGKLLGIRMLDHIILGHDDYFSFADAGALEYTADNVGSGTK